VEESRRELIEGAYAALNRREWDVVPELCHPDFEWTWPKGMADTDVFRGQDGFRRGVEAWLDPWDECLLEPAEVLERADELLVIVRYSARGGGSGMELDQLVAHLWEFRGGRASRLRMFGDVEKARRRFLEATRPDAGSG
jgi:ketosteroid isomerase-like protein